MKIKLSTIRNTIVSFLLVILGGILGFRYAQTGSLPLGLKLPFVSAIGSETSPLSKVLGKEAPIENSEVNFAVFWEVWSLLEREYLDSTKIDAEKMVNGAVYGMTSSLGDPYTVYLAPEANQRSGEDLAGSFYGVGIELGYKNNILAVVSPLDGTPAKLAGVQAGDLILHVKDLDRGIDEDTAGWSLTQAVEKIRGRKGTDVILTLFREGQDKPFDLAITRGEIIVKSVTLDFVEHAGKRVAYLKLSRFGERTEAEWAEAVAQILAQRNSISGIVLDMRNNPGGYFDVSIDIASDFIKKGVVVSQKGKYRSKDFYRKGQSNLADLPLVVLVNRGSASASEIVAGALRDNLEVKLVGERTFGKGTVQDRRVLSNGGGVHITIGRWMLPKGEWIHEEGIPVNVEVKDNLDTEADEVLLKGIEEL
ncbi:MAG: S41 family peptidase [Candidatus Woesebacteria bacterium]|jgi:carboxyl-terminal processing protease